MEKTQLDQKKAEMSGENNIFFSSGATLLDLALGGGWALGKIFNIVGDKSSNKTGIAIEAFANFDLVFPKARMRYGEAESAFNDAYAALLGFPDSVTRPEEPLKTIEDFRDDLAAFIKDNKSVPSLYILDSLDALSDDTELEQFRKGKTDEGSYGTAKAKQMSKLFRLLVQDVKNANCSLGIISQIRDRIGVTMGETKSRSGGHALDFFCTHILWLAQVEKMTKGVSGEDREIGVKILAKCKKNKVGMPFRDVTLQLLFQYGFDDELSNIEWLKAVKSYEKETADDLEKKIKKARVAKDFKTLDDLSAQIKQDTIAKWKEMEEKIAPPISKYNRGASNGSS